MLKGKMKPLKIALLTILLYTSYGISSINAYGIDSAISRVTLSQGERKEGVVVFNNDEDTPLEISITPYSYNPKNDDISEDTKKIFIKADTDTITVNANSSFNIKYEIYPFDNLQEGSYFNILAITPKGQEGNINISSSIAQLVILDIVSPENQIKGVATDKYSVHFEIESKGIPFISPLKLKYSINNNSNYVITPQGRVDIFNEKNRYKSKYLYLNQKQKKVYPRETLEKKVEISYWHISDIFLKRIIKGEVFNGIDGVPKAVEIELPNYILEFIFLVVAILVSVFFVKSVYKDLSKKKLKQT